MSIFALTLAYLRDRKLATLLNILLLTLGVATLVLLRIFASQLESRLDRDAQGIDLVVGAKGSPMQLILSGVFHIDAPTGNIPLETLDLLRRQPTVGQAIPLALGDNFRGFRIVGTEAGYLDLYGAELADGRLFDRPMEAVIGSAVAAGTHAALGQRFTGSHGLGEGGHSHEDTPFTVVGRLKPTGTVVDRLILTPVESVWNVHGIHHEEHEDGHEHAPSAEETHGHHHDHDHDHEARPAPAAMDSGRQAELKPEVTAILVRYRSALGAVQLPGFINRQTDLQAAVPAVELARILSLVGIGLDTMRVLALLQMLTAALSIFVALYGSLQKRQGDMALLRVIGASRGQVFGQVLLEGLLLAAAGAILGLLLGHAVVGVAAAIFPELRELGVSALHFDPAELLILLGALGLGLLAALIPALQVYRTDIARTLAEVQ
ncbi:ABC transporter permease [Sandaracinobacter sp. RS1-74]|uniref:ABC transporter permease n=1 Tax=Sandaracinobacteroides sayramensis TaxID=2913411 RepID=UPI001ED9FDF6|nr:ABC transporter permease [Sandaracinobacteroides sayramensis]MCG2842054.1 ABC transporter permease [Sandaracinobacteroides sayramensis]